MNFLFVAQGYPGVEGASSGSGVGTYVRELCLGLREGGHRCSVIVWQKGGGSPPMRQEVEGVTVHLLSHAYWPIVERWAPDSRDVFNLRRLVRRLEAESPFDWIEIQSEEGIAIGVQRDFPDKTLLSVHTTLAQMIQYKRVPVGRREKYRIQREQSSINLAPWILLHSHGHAMTLRNEYALTGSICMIPLGVGKPWVASSETRPKDCKKPCILIVGSPDPRKGFDRIGGVFERFTRKYGSARLRIITRDVEKTRQYIWPHHDLPNGLEVQVEERLSAEEMEMAYRDADVVFHPARYESFGLTCIEPARYGVPLVATPVGIVPDLLRGNLATYIVPGDDGDSCADTLKYALENRVDVGSELRNRYMAEFTRDHMVENYLQMIDSIRERKLSRPGGYYTFEAISCRAADVILQCLECGHAVEEDRTSASALCPRCRKAYPRTYGVLNFVENTNCYWGESERRYLDILLKEQTPIGEHLEHIIQEEPGPWGNYLRQHVLDPRRAAWKYLTHIPAGGRVLDFGCGWGGIALEFGELFREVWVADLVPERVAITLRRACEAGHVNYRGCVTSGWPKLPFADNSFDLVVLNGVLEWIPDSIPGKPGDIQAHFLREIRRVLKRDGQLYIAIENRFGYHYFTGKREEHTKLRFISLLPRGLGRIYHQWVHGKDYRAFTYGRWGLKRLLGRNGYAHQVFYCPYPDYREFYKIVDLDDPRQIDPTFSPRTRWGRGALLVSRYTGVLKYCAPSFGVLASAGPRRSFIEELIREQLIGDRADSQSRGIGIKSYFVTSAGNILVRFHWAPGGADFLLTLPVGARAALRLMNETRIRSTLRGKTGSPLLEESLALTEAGVYNNVPFQIEPFCDAQRYSPNVVMSLEQSKPIWEVLARIHSVGMKSVAMCDAPVFERNLMERFLSISRIPSEDFFPLITKPRILRRGLVHGDFHGGNLLADKNGKIIRVIDWDLALLNGLPVWDLLDFYCHSYFVSGTPWSTAFVSAVNKIQSAELSALRTEYAQKLGLTDEDFRVAIATFPLMKWKQKMEYGDQRGEIITDGLVGALREIK